MSDAIPDRHVLSPAALAAALRQQPLTEAEEAEQKQQFKDDTGFDDEMWEALR